MSTKSRYIFKTFMFGLLVVAYDAEAGCNNASGESVSLSIYGPEYVQVGRTVTYTLKGSLQGGGEADLDGGSFDWTYDGFTLQDGGGEDDFVKLIAQVDAGDDVQVGCTYGNDDWKSATDCEAEIDATVIEVTLEVSDLIDNWSADVAVEVTGVSASELTFSLSATPAIDGEKINKMGTSVTFHQLEGEECEWVTSPVYWYGMKDVNECNDFEPDYRFVLDVDGVVSITNICTVQWPTDEYPEMIGSVEGSSESSFSDAEAVSGILNWYRSLIIFCDFEKGTRYVDVPTTDQYHQETRIEEEFHAKQWMGEVSTDEGGQGDCFTAAGIKFALGWGGEGPWYVFGETPDGAEDLAERTLQLGEIDERYVSLGIIDADEGFRELIAKEEANYNAAFTYECVKEPLYGPNPENHDHPAYSGD